jgi:glycosyltransferase involved in cell wall biosynthesis
MVSEIGLFPLVGGVQRHMWTLANFMKKQGHEVDILTSRSEPETKKERDFNGIGIYPTLHQGRPLLKYDQVQLIYDSYDFMKQINVYGEKYDIIHYHGGGGYYFFEQLNLDRPLVTTLHGILPACPKESFLFDSCQSPTPAKCSLCYVANRPNYALLSPAVVLFCTLHHRLMKKGLQKMQKVICVSDYVRRSIERTLKLHNLVTIHNFIDAQEEIKPNLELSKNFDARKLLNIPVDSRIITYFGRLSYEKGSDILIKAFYKVLNTLGQGFYLIIGGTGPQKHQIEEMAKGIDNVRTVGYLSRSKQLGLMAQSDVFVSPSRFADACPTTLIEAAYLGLPIVATLVGGSPEIVVDEENGLLVEPQNPHALANGLIKLLSDERLLSKCKINGPRKAKDFDIGVIGPKILSLYEAVLTSSD